MPKVFDWKNEYLFDYLKLHDQAAYKSFTDALRSIQRWQTNNPTAILRSGKTENVYEHCEGMIELWLEFKTHSVIANSSNDYEITNKIWLHDFPESITGDQVYVDQLSTDEYQTAKNQREMQVLTQALEKYVPQYLHEPLSECYAEIYFGQNTLENALVNFLDVFHGNCTIVTHSYDLRRFSSSAEIFEAMQKYTLTRLFQAISRVELAFPEEIQPEADSTFYKFVAQHLQEWCECGYAEQVMEFGRNGGFGDVDPLNRSRVKSMYAKMAQFL